MKTLRFLISFFLAIAISLMATAQSTEPLQPTKPQPPTSKSFNPEQVKDIQKIIHHYLVNNPQVLLEVSQALQAREMEKAQKIAQQAIKKNKDKLFNDPASPVAGNTEGNVVLVEFFDYQCGHCKAMNQIVQTAIKNNNDLKVIFKELPIFGGNSNYAAQAALASAKQGKYYQFHDALLATDNPLTKTKVLAVAKKIGLNVSKLQQDMKSPKIQQQIRENFQLAQQLQLIGTPAFIISNKEFSQFKFVPGAISQQNLQEQINAVIDAD